MNEKLKRHLTMASRVTQLNVELDATIAKTRVDTISCKKGCAACCYQLLGVTVAEASLIYTRHKKLVEELLPRLREDSLQMDEILLKNGIDPNAPPPKGEPPIMLGPSRELLCDAWWELLKPCPFLDEKKRECRIYEERPASCRSYFVTSDPVLCEADQGTRVNVWTVDQERLAFALAWANGGKNLSIGPVADVLLHVRKELRE
jgi:Fe-S-cluster containining protein